MKTAILFFTGVLIFNLTIVAQNNTISWENNGNDISNDSFGNMHPRMAKDRLGNPLVIWGRMSDQSVMFSKWNGTSFTTPIRLNPSWMEVATATWMGPDIASHGRKNSCKPRC